jgi:hypothetical protein
MISPAPRRALRCLLAVLSVLALFALAGAGTVTPAAQAAIRLPATLVAPTTSGLPFTVADFDGDHQPDLASVQTGSGDSGDYWVRLRLSTAGRRYVHFAAPQGGLLIEARDVNGDKVPDLIFGSARLSRPVAILLNDGHGNFSEVDPTAYIALFANSHSAWNLFSSADPFPFGLLQPSRTGDVSLALCAVNRQREAQSFDLRTTHLHPIRPLTLQAGRAPPRFIL